MKQIELEKQQLQEEKLQQKIQQISEYEQIKADEEKMADIITEKLNQKIQEQLDQLQRATVDAQMKPPSSKSSSKPEFAEEIANIQKMMEQLQQRQIEEQRTESLKSEQEKKIQELEKQLSSQQIDL